MLTGVAAIEAALVDRLGGADAQVSMRRAVASLLNETGFEKPPVKLSSIAKFLGARIQYDASKGIGSEEASLKIVDNSIVLWVSRTKFENIRTRTRARFSIAHEIAHLILYKVLGPSFLEVSEEDASTYKFVEHLCDATASHLLIPRSFLTEATRSYGISSHGISNIARAFDVSYMALLRAIADLSKDGAVLEWRFFQRNTHEQCTWRVWQCHTASWTDDKSSWLPSGSTMKHVAGIGSPDELAFDQAVGLQGIKLIRGKKQLERDAVICRWPIRARSAAFDFVELDNSRAQSIKMDQSKGRLMMLVGARHRVDFNQYRLDEVE